jgi:hypothetical protein
MVEYRHAFHGYMTCMAAAWKGRMLSWMHVHAMQGCMDGVHGRVNQLHDPISPGCIFA